MRGRMPGRGVLVARRACGVQEAELPRSGQGAIGAEARLGVRPRDRAASRRPILRPRRRGAARTSVERWAGTRPASRMSRRSSTGGTSWPYDAPAEVEMDSLIRVPPMSLAARGEQDLGELGPFLDPRALDVAEERAQEEARQRVHPDDLEAGGALAHAGHEAAAVHRRLLVDQRERDELGEAARLLLDAAEQIHVPDPVLGPLHVAVHDGGGGPDALGVRGGDHLDPLLDRDAAARDDVADLLVQHLGRGARAACRGPTFLSSARYSGIGSPERVEP